MSTQTLYHITDQPHFALDAHHVPDDNTFALHERTRPGLYGTKDATGVERWVNGSGYVRPYVAEIHAPAEHVHDERWGGESFLPAEHFDKATVHRVIPLDAHARETYGDHGWIESHHGTEFDTGNAIDPRKHNQKPGYHYPGPDVRTFSDAEHAQHKQRALDYLRDNRGHDAEDIEHLRQRWAAHVDLNEIRDLRDDVRRSEAGHEKYDVDKHGGCCGTVGEEIEEKHGYPAEWGAYRTPHHPKYKNPEHVWNRLPNGSILDATADQFGEGHDVRVVHPDHPDYHRFNFDDPDDTYEGSEHLGVRVVSGQSGFTDGNAFAERLDKPEDEEPYIVPRKDEYARDYTAPGGQTYRLLHGGGRHSNTLITAHQQMANGKYRGAGYLTWFGGKPRHDGSNIDGGVIHKVHVSGPHQRRGLASAMLDYAREKHPEMDIRHSNALTDAGRAWSEKTAAFGDVRARLPLTDLITTHDAMTEVLHSHRKSETPGEPIEVNPREDMPGKYEIADGHHRVAEAIGRGEDHIDADVRSEPDDEPYEGPFYDFSKHMHHTGSVRGWARLGESRQGEAWPSTQHTAAEQQLYWRLHHPAVPLDAEHARSHTWNGNADLDKPGFSSFAHPHDLHRYMHAMDWIDSPDEVDLHERHVVAFPGKHVGTGVDGEDLVMPTGKPVHKMSWPQFDEHVKTVPSEGASWDISKAHMGSRHTAADWDEFRRIQDTQQRRYERAGVGGSAEDRDRYFGTGEMMGHGEERLITPKDWITHSRGQQLHDVEPEFQEHWRGYQLGHQHGQNGAVGHEELEREHARSPHPEHFAEGYADGLEHAMEGAQRVAHLIGAGRPVAVALHKSAHVSGNTIDAIHCPFCGSGSVTARSDGSIECGFCTAAYTVQVQPQFAAFPQSVDGAAYPWPGRDDMDAQLDGAVPGAQMPPDGSADGEEGDGPPWAQDGADADAEGDDGADDADGDGDGDDEDEPEASVNGSKAPPFTKKTMLTSRRGRLSAEDYMRHLAILHADNPGAMAARIKAERAGAR